MTVIVEDGTVVTGANSYVSESDLSAYALARGITISGDTTTLLIKAMDYIESLTFIGDRLTFSQPLQWPRVNVMIDGWYRNGNEIPVYLKNGQCAVALAIDAGNGPLEDLTPQIKSMGIAGGPSIEYMQGTNTLTIVRTIGATLRKIIIGGVNGSINVSKA